MGYWYCPECKQKVSDVTFEEIHEKCGTYVIGKDETQETILDEIREERRRQHDLRGEQNHLLLHTDRLYFPDIKRYLKERLECFRYEQEHQLTDWYNILMEEVCEVFLETEPEKQRVELIQIAAVAVQIIEYLDRRNKK